MLDLQEPQTPLGLWDGMDKEAFGLRLRELRSAKGISQKALAEAAGVEQSQVSRWEKGESAPLVTSVAAIAKALGVTPGELFRTVRRRPPEPHPGRPRKID
jgi:transcriptional regulator with XRE-family HTH domain